MLNNKNKMIKSIIGMFVLLIVLSSCNSSKSVADTNIKNIEKKELKLKMELVGIWDFEILKDRYGEKVDTILHRGGGFEVASGPLMTFNSDGTYSLQFTHQNTDTGKWYFDEVENAIKLLLYYDKPYDHTAQYLIDKGHATKDENGDYYEVITRKIVEHSNNNLTILGREGRTRTYKKRN